MKTADGTRSGTGVVIGSPTADYRNSSGYILSGPEYLTMFNGQTGAAMSTVNYTPARGTVSSWGDSYGNRVDRFLAGTAYLDPSRAGLEEFKVDEDGTSADTRLLTAGDVHSNNGTKATPALSADLFGDWREEVIWPTTNNTALRVYSTPILTDRKVVSLMHDPQYREAIAWQNTAYNQPPHPSFAIQ
ncbi:hypothetical protein FB565_006193 [Actinoplanes lutulentus]|uniref:Rhamnogalacturonan lyase family 11 C-terminal domain-containing protein n=1 Tax=Actinoplanes lutulentus TaxID=1287878 RepID=A0A327YX22_9ACTN|nr:hypothetical protein [Actinoplanes lutulentus]RAK25402.1 hypothetical protein B0I29_13412 [Actinoplanes lutulentus]